ncbi:MAG: hypothetical protein LBB75_08660 [Oscillospiraceae bacterium]|jgi:hypothetical protein|nr:hypothetical protein [Oscillospiraceae bacterium]
MNNNRGISRAPAVAAALFAALALAALLPLRLWQQLHLVEDITGFWAGGGVTVPLLYVGLGVLAAVPAAAAFALRKRAALDLTRRRRVIEGVTAALAAAALAVDAVTALRFALGLISGAGGGAFFDGMEAKSSPAVYYIRSGAMACVLEGVFGMFGAAVLGQLAAADFLPRKKIYLGRALALAPFVWAVCRILRRFSRTIAYLRVSDLFLSLAMLTALMLFLLAFAQCVSGRYGGGKAAALLGAGVPAAVLALVCFVPRAAAYGLLGNMGGAAPADALIEWCDPAMAAFALAFIAGRLFVEET